MPIMPGTVWLPVASHSGPMVNHLGLVLHVQVGNGSCYGEFANPANQASSTWWIRKDGVIEQYVDSDYAAWTEAAGNYTWDSVETEGQPEEPLTNAQILSLARIYVWGYQVYGWPLVLSEDPNARGLGWHGMGGAAWGNHPNCPGDIRKSQRNAALYVAILAINPPFHPPTTGNNDMVDNVPSGGILVVRPDGAVNNFDGSGYYGGMNGHPMNAPIVGIAATPSGRGYWMVGADGAIFTFGDAPYLGPLPKYLAAWNLGQGRAIPVVGIARGALPGVGYTIIGDGGGASAAAYRLTTDGQFAR